ncbi:MAG: SGNH/GDSL hydrolase family protein [bacterium]|nr:SGNH/GDSL hydrolase family protein [bacterium]
MKVKILLASILTILTLEISLRLYDYIKLQIFIKNFKGIEDSPDYYKTFENWLNFSKKLTILNKLKQWPSSIYTPIIGIKPMPTEFNLKNIHYKINSHGFRSEELPEVKTKKRVFILGGSTVFGGHNEKWTITHYLKEKLGNTYEVINAGVIGYSSFNEILLLKTQILNLQPDVVIFLNGRNDIYYNSAINKKHTIALSFYDSIQKLLDDLVNRPNFFSLTKYYIKKTIISNSALLTKLYNFYFSLLPKLKVYESFVEISDAAINSYLLNLKIIKLILEENKIKGIIAFQPTLGYGKKELSNYEKSILEYFKKIEKTNWMDEVNKKWKKIGKLVEKIPDSNLVKTLDLSEVFINEKETCYHDSVHYTPIGCKLIANKLASIIKNL